jgi:hypothetical protein
MKEICSYTFASRTRSYRDDVWPSLPYTDEDREIDLLRAHNCRYCGEILKFTDVPDSTATSRSAYLCSVCGYWFVERQVVGGQDNIDIGLTIGEAYHYAIDELEIPVSDLRRYLRLNPDDVAHINPFAFERLVADCVKSAFGPCEVIQIGGVKDKGIDLKLVQNDSTTFLIQVKRRSDLSRKEGVKVVRELNGVLFREGKTKGMIITTAVDFTKAAKDETKVYTKTKDRYEMELLCFDDFVAMLMLPDAVLYEPWNKHLQL